MYTLAWRARSGLIGLALFAGSTATARADDAQAFGFEAAAQEITQLLWLADTARVCGWASEDEAMRFKQFSIRFINSHLTGVYKAAINSMLEAANRALEDANLDPEDLACIIPHQANLRIIEAIAHRFGVPLDRFVVNLDRYGNTSAAAVAIALDEAHRTGRMKVGDYVLLVVFGGGLTWAASVIQW